MRVNHECPVQCLLAHVVVCGVAIKVGLRGCHTLDKWMIGGAVLQLVEVASHNLRGSAQYCINTRVNKRNL